MIILVQVYGLSVFRVTAPAAVDYAMVLVFAGLGALVGRRRRRELDARRTEHVGRGLGRALLGAAIA